MGIAAHAGQRREKTFNRGGHLWSKFSELVELRDEFVHPKHERPTYYEYLGAGKLGDLDLKNIPEELNVEPKDLVFQQTQIPKDPYRITIPHVNTAKSVVDEMIDELDKFLGGAIKAGDWLRTDTLTLVYPPGAKLGDMDNTRTEAAAKSGKLKP
jgi:hypothetical protein